MNTITAVTAEPAEFFRVISWCYEVADIGHLVRATVQDRHCELRATLAKDDLCLSRLTALIRNEPLWQLIKRNRPSVGRSWVSRQDPNRGRRAGTDSLVSFGKICDG